MNELIDVCTLGVCFEVHKSLRLGNWELLEEKDEETQKEYGEYNFSSFNLVCSHIPKFFIDYFRSLYLKVNFYSLKFSFRINQSAWSGCVRAGSSKKTTGLYMSQLFTYIGCDTVCTSP